MLLIRPLPARGESLRGYIFRVADENGLYGLREFFGLIDPIEPEKVLSCIAAFLGCTKAVFKGLFGWVPKVDGIGGLKNDRGLPLRFWNTSVARFCPVCFSETSAWKANWELALVVACPKHGIRLVDTCTQCGQEIRWSRKRFTACRCGQYLREMTTKPCSKEELWLSELQERVFSSLLAHRSAKKDDLSRLNLEDLIALIWFVGAYRSGLSSAKPLKITGIYQVSIARALVQAAGETFSDWPYNYHSFLFEVGGFVSNTKTETSLGRRFGFFYHSLYKKFKGPQFEFLHQAFEEFLRNHWPGSFTKRNRRLSRDFIQDHHMLPLPAAKMVLHVSDVRIKQLIGSGKLIASSQITATGRQVIAIDRQSLQELQARWENWITFSEARHILGLSRNRFRNLMERGIVKAEAGPTSDGSAIWRFSRTGIEVIKTKLKEL